MKNLFLPLIIVVVLTSCNAYKPYYHKSIKGDAIQSLPNKTPDQSIFLLGDAGKTSTESLSLVFKHLQNKISQSSDSAHLLILGDNIYPIGLVNEGMEGREKGEKILKSQMKIRGEKSIPVIFIPGNHDWEQGGKNGHQYVLNQEKYIEGMNMEGIEFIPSEGCPGPVLIHQNGHSAITILDTQWWLHPHTKPGAESNCSSKNDEEFLKNLSTTLKTNSYATLHVVAAHHPMESVGPHGAHFPLRSHIFPLTEFKKKAYIPLPGLGTIYVLLRKYVPNIQDIPHKRYNSLRKQITNEFANVGNVVYVNGHDHSLQLISKNKTHYITSGAGSKVSHAVKNNKATFAHAAYGYGILERFDKEWFLSFYSTNSKEKSPELVYRRKLK